MATLASTTQTLFKLSKEQINSLKLKASLENGENKLSTYEVVAGHVWRSAGKARGLAEDEEIKLRIPIDGRSRLKNPPLPQGYFGNVIFYASCTATIGDLASKPLGYIASEIHETLKSTDDEEYLRSTIDYMESKPGLPSPFLGTLISKTLYPNITVNSWGRLSYKEMDFGWDSPTFFGISRISYEGQCFLIPSPDGDGSMTIAIHLFTSHLPIFEKHLHDF